MKATKKTRIPSLRHCNNRGLVCLNGKRIYLGEWGAQETHDAYERVIAEWLANKQCPIVSPKNITIAELYRDYWYHCEDYYQLSNGEISSSRKVKKLSRTHYAV